MLAVVIGSGLPEGRRARASRAIDQSRADSELVTNASLSPPGEIEMSPSIPVPVVSRTGPETSFSVAGSTDTLHKFLRPREVPAT